MWDRSKVLVLKYFFLLLNTSIKVSTKIFIKKNTVVLRWVESSRSFSVPMSLSPWFFTLRGERKNAKHVSWSNFFPVTITLLILCIKIMWGATEWWTSALRGILWTAALMGSFCVRSTPLCYTVFLWGGKKAENTLFAAWIGPFKGAGHNYHVSKPKCRFPYEF